jgi:hypothetical protein
MSRRRSGRSWRGAPAAAALVATLLLSGCARETRPTVVLYGDSLGQEAADALGTQLDGVARFEDAAVGGAALCDTLDRIRTDVREDTPTYALIQYSGNNITACMRQANGRPLEGAELAAKYRTDAETAVQVLRDRGVEVYLVGSPSAALTFGAQFVNAEFQQIAQQWERRGGGVHYIDAGTSVAPGDTFTRTLPCLKFETSEFGCDEGRIPVRAPDGNHFCPPGADATLTASCPVWSSGAYRFAAAMAEPLLTQIRSGPA